MWTCPKCHREFDSKNQWHSCVIVNMDDLFTNSAENVVETYEALKKQCDSFCDLKIDTTRSCLYFVCNKRFLAIKPKRKTLQLEFVLNREVDLFPIYKTVRIAKFRFAHFMVLDSPEDINQEVLSWIEEAYELLAG